MPPLAVCLFGVDRGETIPSANILSLGDGFEVIWVKAGWVATEMVNNKARRYRRNQRFIGRDVGAANTSKRVVEVAISLLCPATGPFPAIRPFRIAGDDFHSLGQSVKCSFHTHIIAKMVPKCQPE